jgi:hypothetical protein
MSREHKSGPWLPPRWFIRGAWMVHRAIYHISGGRLGLAKPAPGKYGMMRVTTIGRRSGAERSAILAYYEDGPNLVTLAMNGWGEGEPAWWLNLMRHPDARRTEGRLAGGARPSRGGSRTRTPVGEVARIQQIARRPRPVRCAAIVQDGCRGPRNEKFPCLKRFHARETHDYRAQVPLTCPRPADHLIMPYWPAGGEPSVKNQTGLLHDTKVDVKVVLCGLSISMLFVFAYVDIFGFWRADVINGTRRQSPRPRLRDQRAISCLRDNLHPDPKPHGYRLAARPSTDEQNNQHRRQPDLPGIRGRIDRRRNLDLLHPRECRRGDAPPRYR